METRRFVAACCLILTASAYGAREKDEHGHIHDPVHGGIVVDVRDIEYELVAKPDSMVLHLRREGKPMDVSKASAKLTLLSGQQKQEIQLRPSGDRLEATGSFAIAPGTKALVVVTGATKSASTARFELK